jgi:hypothetical protein
MVELGGKSIAVLYCKLANFTKRYLGRLYYPTSGQLIGRFHD